MANSFYTTNPYMARAFAGGCGTFDLKCQAQEGAKAGVDSAVTEAQSKLKDPAIQAQVNDIATKAAQNAVHGALDTAKNDVLGGIFGGLNSLGTYTPYILVGAGLIAVIMLMW